MSTKKAIDQLLLFLEILKVLSHRRWMTQTQLRQVLALRGYEISELKLQRMLKVFFKIRSIGRTLQDIAKP